MTSANARSDGSERYRPDDECPLFSERLEEHLVAVLKGQAPNRGRFCGQCYTPMSGKARGCGHCETQTGDRSPVDRVPEPIVEMLRKQRSTESWIVNSFAFGGLAIALVGGLLIVLGIPAVRGNLIWATILYGLILLVGGRVLAGVLGGYYGDRVAYARARNTLRESWASFVEERDRSGETADT